ncbi:MAG: DUF4339 domain-containing protein [Akkermansia sp.]|nr:DUF4339 domain-containing protein [Akkermansia sp.]
MARKYFYDTGEEKIGPVTGNDLVQLRASGQIDNKTWVRRDDSETWRPLGAVNLREEEEEEANPSLWRLLTRHMSVSQIILIVSVIVVLAVLLLGVLSVAWPFILVALAVWFLARAVR